jgi:hypothetical protein
MSIPSAFANIINAYVISARDLVFARQRKHAHELFIWTKWCTQREIKCHFVDIFQICERINMQKLCIGNGSHQICEARNDSRKTSPMTRHHCNNSALPIANPPHSGRRGRPSPLNYRTISQVWPKSTVSISTRIREK